MQEMLTQPAFYLGYIAGVITIVAGAAAMLAAARNTPKDIAEKIASNPAFEAAVDWERRRIRDRGLSSNQAREANRRTTRPHS